MISWSWLIRAVILHLDTINVKSATNPILIALEVTNEKDRMRMKALKGLLGAKFQSTLQGRRLLRNYLSGGADLQVVCLNGRKYIISNHPIDDQKKNELFAGGE